MCSEFPLLRCEPYNALITRDGCRKRREYRQDHWRSVIDNLKCAECPGLASKEGAPLGEIRQLYPVAKKARVVGG